jgi:hypothetical protein
MTARGCRPRTGHRRCGCGPVRTSWDRVRGPRVSEVEFCNDLSPEPALELVCDTVGEVDIVTEVPHAAAEQIRRSRHAWLISMDVARALAGVVDREAEGLASDDRRARAALEPRDRPVRAGP